MSAVVFAKTKDMTREEWLAERQKGIGGSDAAAAVGLDPYKSRIRLWNEKTGRIEPEEAGEAALWGTIMEAPIADEFARRNGFRIQRCNAILQHPEHPFMLVNLDRYVSHPQRGRGVLEVKFCTAWNKQVSDDAPPQRYLIQCFHELAVSGCDYAYLAILKDHHYCQYLIERDEETINYLIRAEKAFWDCVTSDTPPELDGSGDCTELLGKLYPDSNGQMIQLPPTAETLIAQYEQAKADEEEASTRKDEAANKLKGLLGENEVGLIGERKVTWKGICSSRLDTKALKAECPEVYTKYARESVSRRFEIR